MFVGDGKYGTSCCLEGITANIFELYISSGAKCGTSSVCLSAVRAMGEFSVWGYVVDAVCEGVEKIAEQIACRKRN